MNNKFILLIFKDNHFKPTAMESLLNNTTLLYSLAVCLVIFASVFFAIYSKIIAKLQLFRD